MLAAFLIAIGCLSFAFSALVLRADVKSRDSRLFAAMGIVDGAISLGRAALLLEGHHIADLDCEHFAGAGSFLLAYLGMEFAYSFPFNRRPPALLRAVLALATAVSLVLFTLPATFPWFGRAASYTYFLPSWGVMSYYLAQNYRRTTGDRAGIALVIVALTFRWLTGIATYLVAWRISFRVYAGAVLFEATGAVLVGFLLLAYAVLRNHLFRVRGIVADVMLYATFALAILVATGAAVEASLGGLHGGALRAALIASALLPVAILALAGRLRAPIEDALDPRRALRKGILERVLRSHEGAPEPEAQVKVAETALGEITLGGKVRFLRAQAWPVAAPGAERLPEALTARLAEPEVISLHRAQARGGELAALGADLVVPVKTSQTLYGALVVTGGQLDRDSLLAALALASQLTLKLENYALFARLEESRRLAALGSFAAAIAHDIRTPLTSVQMNVQILRGKVSLPPDDMEYFDIALDELRRLNVHIQEILDYAKPVRIEEASLDLREVCDDAARGIGPILEGRKLSLERADAAGLPAVVGDAERMRQVLLNLLDNAAKASPEGGSITLSTRADGEKVAIEVSDHGRGIDADSLARIFEPFYTTRPDGTGLGLAIVQKLVTAHHGEIRVKSQPGEGSTFTVLLPAAA